MTVKEICKMVENYNALASLLGEPTKKAMFLMWVTPSLHYDPITATNYKRMAAAIRRDYIPECAAAILAGEYMPNTPTEITHGYRYTAGTDTVTVEIAIV